MICTHHLLKSFGTRVAAIAAMTMATAAPFATTRLSSARAQEMSSAPSDPAPRDVRIVVSDSTIDVLGRTAPVFRVVTKDGGSIVRGREGERLRIVLENRSSLPTAVHPHGLILPNAQDGVPYITQLPVNPGETFTYDFVPVQAGTYFFHAHYGWELQDQLAIPFILDPPVGSAVDAQRADPSGAERGSAPDSVSPQPQEVVMMLTDFTFGSPPEIFAKLRAEAGRSADGGSGAMGGMNGERGMKPDLTDVTYDAMLANGRPIANAEVVRVKPGSPVLLRLINASGASNFAVDLGGLRGRATSVDGEPIHPVELDRVELAVAQRIDVMIDVPASFTAAPLVAQAEGTKLLAAVVLAAPGAEPPQLPASAEKESGPIGADYRQERSFRAMTPLLKRPVDRSFVVKLTGDMAAYVWGLNDAEWPKTPPLTVGEGQRVELVFDNRTMMSHPMHLHGHRFQVTEIDGKPVDGAYRDTILVMPKSTVKVEFDADNPGLWMMHCHLLWHEAAGMLGVVEYEGYPKPDWYKSVDTFMQPSSLPRR